MNLCQLSNKSVKLGVFLLLLTLVMTACTGATGPSVDFKAASELSQENATINVEDPALDRLDRAEPGSSYLGFVYKKGEAVEMINGGRVPLGEDKIVEVFISPYPPDWQTDLHLFLLDRETFQPLEDVDVDLTYEMVYMDHGIDAAVGTKMGNGHYVLPLAFLMYGDWQVDTTVLLPEGKKHLRFIVKFYP